MTCERCIHFEGDCISQSLSYVERWRADTRPEPKTFLDKLKWFWDPNAFRMIEPDEWDISLHEARLEDRRLLGRCSRYPRSTIVTRDYGCGDFEPSDG